MSNPSTMTPEITSSYTLAGLVYPTLDAMADDMYGLAFAGDHITGLEYKYGHLAPSLNQIDVRWLEGEGEETDPIKRTRAYLDAVKTEASARLSRDSCVHFDRHDLDDIFDIAHVGTPYDRDSITIHRHDDGYLLSHFGGGYAGDANLVQLSQRHTDRTGTTYPVYNGLTTHYRFDSEGLETIDLPMRAIAEAAAEAAESLGLQPADIALDGLKKLWLPFTESRNEDDKVGFVDIVSSPATAPFVNCVNEGQQGARVHLGDRFRSYDWHTPDSSEKIVTDGGKTLYVRQYTPHPAHRADVETGAVTYGINPEMPSYGTYSSVTVELAPLSWGQRIPENLNRDLNVRLKAAAALLRAPFAA